MKKSSRKKRQKSKRVSAEKAPKRWSWVVYPALGLVLIAFLSLMLKGVTQQQQKDTVQAVSSGDFQKEVLGSKVPVLVDFWAPWCGPCRMFAPTVDKIAKDYEGRLKVAKVNFDENRDLVSSYGIQAIPTSMIFKDGALVQQWVGVTPESELRETIERLVAVKAKS